MRALPFLVVLSLTACHRDSGAPAAPVSTAEQDALWKLAPAGTKLGVVVSPRGVAMLDHAWADVRAFIAATPELAPMLVKLANVVGTPDLSLASFGLTATKGAAMFVLGHEQVVIVVPLGDRDKFLAAVHGTKGEPTDMVDKNTACATTHGVYACASAALLDKLGGAGLDASAAGARGDIELVAHDFPIDHKPASFAMVAQLARGAVTVRGSIAGMPSKALAMLGDASQPRIDNHSSGFALAHVKALLATISDDGTREIKYGITQREVVSSIGDPLTITMLPGSYELQLPLTNPAPLKTLLIDHCADGPLAVWHATAIDGTCHVSIPNVPDFAFDLWIDNTTLHIADKSAPPAPAPTIEPSPIAKELAAKPWQIALYGRGSTFDSTRDLNAYSDQIKNLPPELVRLVRPIVRALGFLNETAIAVNTDGDRMRFVFYLRTAWSNPDDVVAKLLAIDLDAVMAGKGMQAIKPIVDAAPDSPLATDVRAGHVGIETAPLFAGAISAAAIPAVIGYMTKVKQVEAKTQLNRIGRRLVMAYGEDDTFPVGDTPLVPASPCCNQPDHACAIDPAAFERDPIWSKLEFSLEEPTHYQYRYHSDGKTADVEAIGDLDCDGAPTTYTLRATSEHGATFDVTSPPDVE
jgi:hypothetical protein